MLYHIILHAYMGPTSIRVFYWPDREPTSFLSLVSFGLQVTTVRYYDEAPRGLRTQNTRYVLKTMLTIPHIETLHTSYMGPWDLKGS